MKNYKRRPSFDRESNDVIAMINEMMLTDTIKSISKGCNLSTMTISRMLNGNYFRRTNYAKIKHYYHNRNNNTGVDIHVAEDKSGNEKLPKMRGGQFRIKTPYSVLRNFVRQFNPKDLEVKLGINAETIKKFGEGANIWIKSTQRLERFYLDETEEYRQDFDNKIASIVDSCSSHDHVESQNQVIDATPAIVEPGIAPTERTEPPLAMLLTARLSDYRIKDLMMVENQDKDQIEVSLTLVRK